MLTWGSLVLSSGIACWGWLNYFFPERFTEGPFISGLQVLAAGLVAWFMTLYSLLLLVSYLGRRQIMIMEMAWQFRRYQDVPPPAHLMDHALLIAQISGVGDAFRAFLASYPDDMKPTTEVVNNQLRMLLDEKREKEEK